MSTSPPPASHLAVLAEPRLPLAEARALGATWSMLSIEPERTLAEVRSRIAAGPLI